MSVRSLAIALHTAVSLTAVSCHPKPSVSVDDVEQDSIEMESENQFEDSLTEYEEAVEELAEPKKRVEAFSDFFFSFLNNRRFQADRVKFPFTIEQDGMERTITSGRDFRAFFNWPHADEYCMLLTDEEQMEELQNSLDLTDVGVQVIELANVHVRNFDFHREKEEWRCMRASERFAHGTKADFLRFYHKFTTDSVFQQQSLAKEIHYCQPDPDDETEFIEGTLEPYQWVSFRPELPGGRITDIVFGQQLEGADQILLMHCGTANSMMDIFTFRRQNGRWHLVSFKS